MLRLKKQLSFAITVLRNTNKYNKQHTVKFSFTLSKYSHIIKLR
jgi:hypothetical protein